MRNVWNSAGASRMYRLMSDYSRNDVDPNWEPVPWDCSKAVADAQERAFQRWALTKLQWVQVKMGQFPDEGIFGHDRDWFAKNDIRYVANCGAEQLVLIDRTYFGFPDPPRWGVAVRAEGAKSADWSMLGSFPDIPGAWDVPNQNG